MALRFGDLLRWEGKVGRKTYALVGVIGFAIKHNIDRLIAANFFSVTSTGFWPHMFNYWPRWARRHG
jgi:hypothetical protein